MQEPVGHKPVKGSLKVSRCGSPRYEPELFLAMIISLTLYKTCLQALSWAPMGFLDTNEPAFAYVFHSSFLVLPAGHLRVADHTLPPSELLEPQRLHPPLCSTLTLAPHTPSHSIPATLKHRGKRALTKLNGLTTAVPSSLLVLMCLPFPHTKSVWTSLIEENERQSVPGQSKSL